MWHKVANVPTDFVYSKWINCIACKIKNWHVISIQDTRPEPPLVPSPLQLESLGSLVRKCYTKFDSAHKISPQLPEEIKEKSVNCSESRAKCRATNEQHVKYASWKFQKNFIIKIWETALKSNSKNREIRS